MSSTKRKAQIGDIVLLKQGIGVIRYYGNVDFDESHKYYGVELKGPRITGGHNGTYNGKKYFTTTGGDGRGIFVLKPIRVISSEEILEKLAEIYDILKSRKTDSHWIDRATYDDLYVKYEELKEEFTDKCSEIEDLTLELSLKKEQISMMKGTLGDKIEETAKMTDKIVKAEIRLGGRLSQVNLDSVKQQLELENTLNMEQLNESQPMQIPDYSQSTNTTNINGIENGNNSKKGQHRKQRSSTTIELDQLQDNFSDIARTVQSYGQKDIVMSGPMHYRKFSNTTKQIMEQHKNAGVKVGGYEEDDDGFLNGGHPPKTSGMNGKSKGQHRARGSIQIGSIVDDEDIENHSEHEYQQKLERDSEDEDSETIQQRRKPKTRTSRESRQLDNNEVNQGSYFDDEYYNDQHQQHNVEEEEQKERESNDEEQTNDKTRPEKTRASRQSRQLHDVEVILGAEDGNESQPPPKRTGKTRASRESRQLDDEDVGSYDEEEDVDEDFEDVMDVEMGDNQQVNEYMNGNGNNTQQQQQKKSKRARGSFQLEQPILSTSVLETHNEHQMEEEAAVSNGPKGDEMESSQPTQSHKRSDTLNSNSSAYKAFMSVD